MTMRGMTLRTLGLAVFVTASVFLGPVGAIEAFEFPASPPRSFDDDDQPPPGRLAGPRPPRGPAFGDDEIGPDRRERMDRRFRRFRERPEMSAERIDEFMALLAEKLPGLHTRLQTLREDNAEEFQGVLHRLMPLFREYYGLSERHPELAETVFEEFRIERELRELSREYQAAQESGDAETMTRTESEIRERVRRQLDIRMQRREVRLAEFGERIEAQKRKLQEELAEFRQEQGSIEELTDQRVERIKKGKMRDFERTRRRGHRGPPSGKFGPSEEDEGSSRFGPGDGPPRGDRKFPRDRRRHRMPPPPDEDGD